MKYNRTLLQANIIHITQLKPCNYMEMYDILCMRDIFVSDRDFTDAIDMLLKEGAILRVNGLYCQSYNADVSLYLEEDEKAEQCELFE